MIIKDGKKIAEIVQPGDYFGEMSALTGAPRNASIVAKGRTKINRFPGDKLMELIEKYPEIGKFMVRSTADRLNRANDIIVKLVKKQQSIQQEDTQQEA